MTELARSTEIVDHSDLVAYCCRMVTREQCKAGRALVGWSQTDLADAADVGLSTVRDFETGKRTPINNNLSAIKAALERAGVEFIAGNGGGPGVRLRDPSD